MVPFRYHCWGMPGGQAGSLFAVYAQVQCQEPKRKRFNSIVKTINFSYLPFLFIYDIQYVWHKKQKHTVASAPSVTNSAFMRRFRLFGTVCTGILAKDQVIINITAQFPWAVEALIKKTECRNPLYIVFCLVN